MPLPKPEPGLVIHYEYLWRHEHERGDVEGQKRRPCAIVVAVQNIHGNQETVVAPITHLEPQAPAEGIEIPLRVKKYLGLDDQRSWVIVSDLNVFLWPGVDIYQVPNLPSGTFAYGLLPPVLFEQIRARIEALGTLLTQRSEDP
ncbi:MAG TPA: growth inhibitor PemK [Rhodospirillaceae bacterium]|nr:growth inhibitor PemK [Rhodospirillaceae bacterium]